MKSELEAAFLANMKLCDRRLLEGMTREHHFHDTRRWRFDFAWPARRVAVEIEGGIYTKGRHTRVSGFVKDCEKYNAAALLGWKVLRYTEKDLDKRPAQVVDEVRAALEVTR